MLHKTPFLQTQTTKPSLIDARINTNTKTNTKTNINTNTQNQPQRYIHIPNHNYDILVKIITLGDYGVGKTTFMKSLVSASSNQSNQILDVSQQKQQQQQYDPTIGVDFTSLHVKYTTQDLQKSLLFAVSVQKQKQKQKQKQQTYHQLLHNNELRMKAYIWDTAGQERFLPLIRAYFNKTSGVLLIFDVTNKKTFQNLQVWIDRISEVTNPQAIYITLIGNKTDLEDKIQVTQEDINGFLHTNKALHIEYFSCSSFDTIKPTEILRHHLAKIFIHRDNIHLGVVYNTPHYIPHTYNYQERLREYNLRYGKIQHTEKDTSYLIEPRTHTYPYAHTRRTCRRNPFSCILRLFKKKTTNIA
jgi:small GTP-binding protein